MQFLFDHISSFLVFGAIMLIVGLIQLRGMQSNAETTVNYMVRSSTLDISEMLERDLMNMRTQAQTDSAIARGVFSGGALTSYQCQFTANGDTTLTFEFPTLSDPQTDFSDPMAAPVAQVMYTLDRELGHNVSRLVGGTTQTHPLYRLNRFVAGSAEGWSDLGVTFFKIEYAENGNPIFQSSPGQCPVALSKVRFQLQMAQEAMDEISDQESRTQLNFSRYGATVELSNWD